MPPLSLVLVATVCLAACNSKPAAPVAESRNPKPSASAKPASTAISSGTEFSGLVGQLDDGAQFIEFITNHESQAVTLDVRFPSATLDGGRSGDTAYFIVWDDCGSLPEGRKPNSAHCTGFEYDVPKGAAGESPLTQESGGWRLRGRFEVGDASGPRLGLMTVLLSPLPQQPGGAL